MQRLTTLASPAVVLLLACQDPDGPAASLPAGGVGAVAARSTGLIAPSNASALLFSQTQIDISWRDNSQNEIGFEVHRSSTGPSGTFTALTTVGANVVTYRDQGLTALTQYCYRVRAVRVGPGNTAYSAFSATTCATTPPPPIPAAASGATAVAASRTSVTISWIDNSTNEDGFRIYRSIDGGAAWELVRGVGANTTSWVTDQPVCYRVVAFNAGGDAAPSNVTCAFPTAANDAIAVESSRISVTVSWSDNSTNEGGFRVYRSTDGGAVWSLAISVGANTTSWLTDRPACYRVVAFNVGGDAAPSNMACAIPAPPTNVAVTEVTPGIFQLTWDDNSSIEDGYEVWQATNMWWCTSVACNAGGSDPQFWEGLVAELPANSTAYGPMPSYIPVASYGYAECQPDCIYVVAKKIWVAGAVAQRVRRLQ